MKTTRRNVLLIEDNEDDAFFMQRAITQAGLDFAVHLVRDGQEALDYLAGHGLYANRRAYPVPSLVFVDLKLPYVDGFDVLEWMRCDPLLRETPVVVLTSSAEERDRRRAADLGVNAYLVKPPTPDVLLKTLRSLNGAADRLPDVDGS